MELLNNTPSPPINVVVNQHQPVSQSPLPNQTEASALLNNSGAMEPNNLSQTAAEAVVSSVTDRTQTTDVTAAAVNQTYTEGNLALKLPLLSSSSSDSESENPTNATAETSVVGDGERVTSPPPNCAICLGRCKNKCFTDSCMHQFCFKCLCEWSKVKPECPLCKQTFKSIIHNVKSIHQFEEYHVQPPTVQIAHPPFEMDFQEMRIFGVVHPGHNRNIWNAPTPRPLHYNDFIPASTYSSSSNTGSIPSASGSGNRSTTTSSGNGSGLRNQYVYRGELLDLYRQDNPGAIANTGTLSQLWRRYVYDRKLYAMPVADITGRFRESSARFYRDNPSQIHRLMPWINRDIVCLLRQNPQHDVTTVLESINSALTIMNILSPAFRRRLQPYLGTKTAHFIHELNNFARSPYDMIGYDRAVQYSPQTNEEVVIEFTTSDESTDNEHADVPGVLNRRGGADASTSTRTSRSINTSSTNAINLTIHNRLTSAASANAAAGDQSANAADILDDMNLIIDLRGEPDNNEALLSGQATINNTIAENNAVGDVAASNIQPTVAENIELTSGSSDECEFILERKPPHLRTPEMVSLDSVSDSDVVFVDETKPLNKTSFSSSEDEHNDNKQRDLHNYHQHNTRNSVSASTRSKITALVEAKKRNNTENLVKSEQQDSQMELYNLGASTSAALRLSLQKRNNKSKRSESSRSRRLRREKYSLRNNERKMPREGGKHLDSESSHSSTSANSSCSRSSFSGTSSTDPSTGSSDDEYVAKMPYRRKTSSSLRRNKSNKRRKTKNTRKRKTSTDSADHSRNKRDGKKRKLSTSDDDDEDDNGHLGKNFALVMAVSERLQRQKNQNKQSSNKKIPNHAREPIDDDNASEGENTWRLKAVNEPLRRQQQQRIKSSHKNNERRRHRRNTNTQEQLSQHDDAHKEDKINSKNIKKRTKTQTQTPTNTETLKPQKIKRFSYDESSSSDESDNIKLIQLKTKLTGQDYQNKNVSADTSSSYNEQNTEQIDSLNDVQATNNANKQTETTAIAAETVDTILRENSESHTTIPNSNIRSDTNETQNTLPSTSHNEIMNVTNTTVDENNFIESILKNDSHDSSDDSNDDEEHGQIKHKHNNDDNTYTNNGNEINTSTESQQHAETSSSLTNLNSSNIDSLQNHYHSDVSDGYENHDDGDDNDDVNDDNEMSSNMPSNTNPNSNLNVFADASSMSSTTTDTMLHDAAEQISSAAVNFYNSQQNEEQQPSFNTAHYADENSTNTSSSSDTSLMSSSSSTSSSKSSSSSINTNYNNNAFMNFKNV